MPTDGLQSGENEVCNTLTQVEADITSLLGIKAPTELCYKKCRRILQASSHNQVKKKLRGMGGEQRLDGIVNIVQRQCGQVQSSRHKKNRHII